MATLVFVPLNGVVATAIGIALGVGVVALLVLSAPVIEVKDGMLRVGRARIEVEHLGEPQLFTGDEARWARGGGLDARSWHLLRGGIDPVVVIPVLDDEDPAPSWVISTRMPDRLGAAVRRAQLTQRTRYR
jgi:hypothetical protein